MNRAELREKREQRTWTCRIGTLEPGYLPRGADLPMRQAVQKVFRDITGVEPTATFSGWGDVFDEQEMAVIEDRLPELLDRSDRLAAIEAVDDELANRLDAWARDLREGRRILGADQDILEAAATLRAMAGEE